jgi:hypothetical protein
MEGAPKRETFDDLREVISDAIALAPLIDAESEQPVFSLPMGVRPTDENLERLGMEPRKRGVRSPWFKCRRWDQQASPCKRLRFHLGWCDTGYLTFGTDGIKFIPR